MVLHRAHFGNHFGAVWMQSEGNCGCRSKVQAICLGPHDQTCTTRGDALERLWARIADLGERLGSQQRARQCLEMSRGDMNRVQDVMGRLIDADARFCADDTFGICEVCGEEMTRSTSFDCGHAVCFACTTGMLRARGEEASFVMACPLKQELACEGRLSFHTSEVVDSLLADPSVPNADTSVWQRYLRCVEDAMLRAAGMYACTSTECAEKQMMVFIPRCQAPGDVPHNTKCESCYVNICVECTHTAGKCVPLHAPLPCTRRVEIEAVAANLLTQIQQAAHQDQQEVRDMQRDMRHAMLMERRLYILFHDQRVLH